MPEKKLLPQCPFCTPFFPTLLIPGNAIRIPGKNVGIFFDSSLPHNQLTSKPGWASFKEHLESDTASSALVQGSVVSHPVSLAIFLIPFLPRHPHPQPSGVYSILSTQVRFHNENQAITLLSHDLGLTMSPVSSAIHSLSSSPLENWIPAIFLNASSFPPQGPPAWDTLAPVTEWLTTHFIHISSMLPSSRLPERHPSPSPRAFLTGVEEGETCP